MYIPILIIIMCVRLNGVQYSRPICGENAIKSVDWDTDRRCALDDVNRQLDDVTYYITNRQHWKIGVYAKLE